MRSLDFQQFDTLTFDCFGTLIDWEQGILDAINPVLRAHDVNIDGEKLLEMYAAIESKHESGTFVSYKIILRMIMTELSLRLGFDATVEETNVLAGSIGNWPPFPDTLDALQRLKKRYKLCILSNVDDALFEKTAARLEVPFDWILTAEQAQAYKPSHKMFEYALEKTGVPKEKILHVAQSIFHDIVPARAMGIATVWVNRRRGKEGAGATPPSEGRPDLEVPDLKSLADTMGL